MSKAYDVLVIGAGAAGMMAAGTAARRGLSVCVIEKNGLPGKKVRITGKGRCNVTNNCDVKTLVASIPTNGRFLYGAASRFSPGDTMDFFEGLGIPLKTERGNRVFPQSDRAGDIADALERFAKDAGARFVTAKAETLLLRKGSVSGVVLQGGEKITGGSVAVCCGGASYPATGSTGDGYRLARQAGHTVTGLRPSLVPLVEDGEDCREMMGLSLRNVSLRVFDTAKDRVIFEDFGELLFTHFGLSGPIILSASSHMRDMAPGRYRILLDLKPALSPEKLDARLVREFEASRNRDFSNSLKSLLPHAMIPVMVRRSGIPPDFKCNSISRETRRSFGGLLKNFEIPIRSFRPIEEAIVTSGGVSVGEIDPRTMESKLVKGLYFAGEVIDVDGYTGGFNLQVAFSTGRLAGMSCVPQEIKEETV